MEAAVTHRGRRGAGRGRVGSGVRSGGGPQPAVEEQGSGQRAERQQKSMTGLLGQRLPPRTDGEHRPPGDMRGSDSRRPGLTGGAGHAPSLRGGQVSCILAPPRAVRWTNSRPGDGLGLAAAICLLVASETSPQSVRLRIFSKSFEDTRWSDSKSSLRAERWPSSPPPKPL